jgi:hypothetical protein
VRKLLLADLDEEEQSMERMRRRFSELRNRDVFHAASVELAERRLKELRRDPGSRRGSLARPGILRVVHE